jgi:farnesyl-diphosphate farnesyltransferase
MASGKGRDSENFPVGSWLIKPALRPHVHVFYNFARAADDISDHPLLEAKDKVRKLEEFAAVIKGQSQANIESALAMRDSLKSTAISPQHCLDLLTAFKRDATQLRYKDWDDLMDYCRYSASPVGRYVLALHGIGDQAWKANDALCSVLQVINHIQDCSDDYRELDRVYIPSAMLQEHGGLITDLSKVRLTPGLQKTILAMLDRCQTMMADASQLPYVVPDIRLKCETSIIVRLGYQLIARLRRCDPLYDNAKLGKHQAAWAAVIGLVRAFV